MAAPRGRRHETAHHEYLLPVVRAALGRRSGGRLLDLGCGTGVITDQLRRWGFDTVGLDFTDAYVAEARTAFPAVRYVQHDLGQPLPDDLCGRFDVVTAVEVVEHLLLPRELFARAREALRPDGVLLVTTPYHGWAKNVAIALLGQSDTHYEPLVDYGHVKFFSRPTLTELTEQCGFEVVDWRFAGRVRPLAKSMVMTARPR